jgi:hypothetical protein
VTNRHDRQLVTEETTEELKRQDEVKRDCGAQSRRDRSLKSIVRLDGRDKTKIEEEREGNLDHFFVPHLLNEEHDALQCSSVLPRMFMINYS